MEQPPLSSRSPSEADAPVSPKTDLTDKIYRVLPYELQPRYYADLALNASLPAVACAQRLRADAPPWGSLDPRAYPIRAKVERSRFSVRASRLMSGERGAALVGVGRFVERPDGTDIVLRISQTGEVLVPILVLSIASLSVSMVTIITVLKTQHFCDARFSFFGAIACFVLLQLFLLRFNNRPTRMSTRCSRR
jgi:hypothetical protein